VFVFGFETILSSPEFIRLTASGKRRRGAARPMPMTAWTPKKIYFRSWILPQF